MKKNKDKFKRFSNSSEETTCSYRSMARSRRAEKKAARSEKRRNNFQAIYAGLKEMEE